jgi:hypothetical protein
MKTSQQSSEAKRNTILSALTDYNQEKEQILQDYGQKVEHIKRAGQKIIETGVIKDDAAEADRLVDEV